MIHRKRPWRGSDDDFFTEHQVAFGGTPGAKGTAMYTYVTSRHTTRQQLAAKLWEMRRSVRHRYTEARSRADAQRKLKEKA